MVSKDKLLSFTSAEFTIAEAATTIERLDMECDIEVIITENEVMKLGIRVMINAKQLM